MYFLMIRPQQKRRREAQAMQSALGRRRRGGDRRRPLRHRDVDIDDETVTLEVAPGVHIRYARARDRQGGHAGRRRRTIVEDDEPRSDRRRRDARRPQRYRQPRRRSTRVYAHRTVHGRRHRRLTHQRRHRHRKTDSRGTTPQGQMRPGRQLAVLAVDLRRPLRAGVLRRARAACRTGSHPKLGLDLVGGTRMTLQATNSLDGKPPTRRTSSRPGRSSRTGSTRRASPRPRWSPRATATSSSRCPAKNR